MQQLSLNRSVNFLLLLFLIFAGLYFGRSFLIPFTLAAIIAMLLLPLTKRLEGRGLQKAAAAGVSLLMLLLLVAGIFVLLGWQISGIAEDFSQMQGKVMQMIHKIQVFLDNKLGITRQEQREFLKSSNSSHGGGMTVVLMNTMSLLVNFILALVYIFILLCFRDHLKKFILRLVPANEMDKTEKVIHDSTQVSYKYLSGLTMMIVMLWILYGIGFSLVGIKNALFFAILCGVLEIIPFVGNLTGTAITVLMALTQQNGGGSMVIGVIFTYMVVQFVQSYIIEPLVVGAEVNINPLFTIVSLVVGEMIWGVAGLVLAIPLIGMIKIIFDNVESLKPYGFLIGGAQKKKDSRFTSKLKEYFNKLKS